MSSSFLFLRPYLNGLREVSNLLIMEDKSILLDKEAISSMFSETPTNVIALIIKNLTPDRISPNPITEELRNSIISNFVAFTEIRCNKLIELADLAKAL